jgi:hypothetical protein
MSALNCGQICNVSPPLNFCLSACQVDNTLGRCYKMFGCGGMAEWFKAAVLKTADRKVREFESLSLRHLVSLR